MRATAAKVRYYHLTSDPHFDLDPERSPAGYEGYTHQPSLFVTPNPELWLRLWEPRMYAAEIDVSDLGSGEFQNASMEDRDQYLIPAKAFDKVKVLRVIKTTEAIKDAKRAGYGFAFMRPSEPGRLCIAKGFGTLEALCGRMLVESDVMEKWTTLRWAKAFPQTCDDCKAKIGKVAKVAAVREVPISTVLGWLSTDAVDVVDGKRVNLPVATVLDHKRTLGNYAEILDEVKRVGVKHPLVRDKDNGLLVDGHRRLAAAIDAGLTTVPVETLTHEQYLNRQHFGALPEGTVRIYRALVLPIDPSLSADRRLREIEQGMRSRTNSSRWSHWTWDKDWAQYFAEELAEANYDPQHVGFESKTRIVIEAHVPSSDLIEDDPEVIERLRNGFDMTEPEVALKPGAEVDVDAIWLQEFVLYPPIDPTRQRQSESPFAKVEPNQEGAYGRWFRYPRKMRVVAAVDREFLEWAETLDLSGHTRGEGACLWVPRRVKERFGLRATEGVWIGSDNFDNAMEQGWVFTHCWNVGPDGTIYDGTAGQFFQAGPIARVIRPGERAHKHYVEWEDIPPMYADEVEEIVQGAYAGMMFNSALSLQSIISVAEHVMEENGLAGKTIKVPEGHADDPIYRKAMEPLEEHVARIVGHSMYRKVCTNEYILRTNGNPQGLVTPTGLMVLRPTTTELTILHECAHLLTRNYGEDSHSMTFARKARDLYLTHLGQEAADVFWRLVGDLHSEGAVKQRYATDKEWAKAIGKGRVKIQIAPMPTDVDRQRHREMVQRQKSRPGGDSRGNNTDRARRERKLLMDFGNGEKAPCLMCRLVLDRETITADRIWPGAVGGSYRYENVVPMCWNCNQRRPDVKMTLGDIGAAVPLSRAAVLRPVARWAPPVSGVIPRSVRADPPVNLRKPRGVTIDPMAQGDIRVLPDDDERLARRTIKGIEQGKVRLDRKQRDLYGCISADVAGVPSLRIVMYLHVDGTWHVFYVGYHDYNEAQRRMAVYAKVKEAAADNAYRGFTVPLLDKPTVLRLLGDLAKGDHASTVEAVMQGIASGPREAWWNDAPGGYGDGAGTWWSRAVHDAETYSESSGDGFGIPVVLTARSNDAWEPYADVNGQAHYYRLAPGVPVEITKAKATLPNPDTAAMMIALIERGLSLSSHQAGDWNDERDGIEVELPVGRLPKTAIRPTRVERTDKTGETIYLWRQYAADDEGWVWASYDPEDDNIEGSGVVGAMRWDCMGEPPYVLDLSVGGEYTRRGIATMLFNFAKESYPSLVHSDVLTDQGRAFRDSFASKTALRGGIPVRNVKPRPNHGASGVVSDDAHVIAYRGFGSWKEMKDSIRDGRWRSRGTFTVKGEGETQMAFALDDVLKSSGLHPLRGTGFLGIIEADISGLPFSTFVTPVNDPTMVSTGPRNDGPKNESQPRLHAGPNGAGMFWPDTGLGIGINGGIPLDRIKRVYEVENKRIVRSWPFSEWESHIDEVKDNPDWSSKKKVVVTYPTGSKKEMVHALDANQDKPRCGAAMRRNVNRQRALIDPEDLWTRPEAIRDFWQRSVGQFSIRESQRCPKCFPRMGAVLQAAAARGRGISFEDLWGAYQPMVWVLGKLPSEKGNWGDWKGYISLAQGKMSYEDALRPAAFVQRLIEEAKRSQSNREYHPTSFHLLAEGRGRAGDTEQWHFAQMDPDDRQLSAPKGSIKGSHRDAKPNARLLNALMYSQGEEARKWIGENLAGVVVDDTMFEHIQEGKKVTVYRGLSIHPTADPLTSVKDDEYGGLGSSWTLSLDTAKAISERGSAGFSGTQTLGDTHRIYPKDERSGRNPNNYVPTVLRAEVEIVPPDQPGAAPYRPWTIDYATEAEVDIPHGTEVVLNGVLQAKKNVRAKGIQDEGHSYEKHYEDVTWSWPGRWKSVNVKRTAGLYESPPEGLVIESKPFSDPFMQESKDEGIVRLTDDGQIYTARVNGEHAGYLRLRQRLSDDVWEIWRVYVGDEWQRRGIASAMLAQAREELGKVEHAPMHERSQEGKGWSRAVGKVAKAMDQYVMYRGLLLGDAEENPTVPEYNRKWWTDPEDQQAILKKIRTRHKSFGGSEGLFGGEWTHSERIATDFALGEANTSYHWFMHHPDVQQVGVVLEVHLNRQIITDDHHPWGGLGEGIVYGPDSPSIVQVIVHVWLLGPGEGNRWRKHLYSFPMPSSIYKAAGQWITDDEGETRWGARGAAGVLFRHTDEEGVVRYLLDKRAHWVDHGGTWGIPGGALDPGESPVEGAYREVAEEFGFMPPHRTLGTHVKRVGDWAYTTVVAEVDEQFTTGRTDESQGSKWFTVEEMSNLHPDLAKAMPALTKISVQTQDVSFKALLIDGKVVKVKRIEQDEQGMWIVTTMNERIPHDRIITIDKGKTAVAGLTFRSGGDANGQQYDGWVAAYLNGAKVGYFDWTLFEGTLHIRYIEVEPEHRGKGIAEEMVDRVIAEQFTDWGKPAPKVDPGMQTPEGSKWWSKVKQHYAMPTSWRSYTNDVFWDDYDVVITSEGGAGTRAYEVFVKGKQIAARTRLDEAKAVVEERYGSVDWAIKRLTPVEVEHYYFGPTTEFTAPKQIWTATLPKATAKVASTMKVYRGMRIGWMDEDVATNLNADDLQVLIDRINEPLGQHWSEDYRTAAQHASGTHPLGHYNTEQNWKEGMAHVGVILHATVTEKDRLTNKDPEWAEVIKRAPIFHHSIEKEFTVRPGAQVRITSAEVVVLTEDQEDYFEVSMSTTKRAKATVAYADFEVDEGKPESGGKFNTGRGSGDDAFYCREENLRRAGMPRGQIFPTPEDIRRYAQPIIGNTPLRVQFSRGGGQAGTVVGKSKKTGQPVVLMLYGHGMNDEFTVLHECAHAVQRLRDGRKGAAHGVAFSAVFAELLWQHMGVGLDLGRAAAKVAS